MKKTKLLSIILASVLSISLISCGGAKTENGGTNSNDSHNESVNVEEAFTTIPEQQLVTDYLKENLQGGEELYQEGRDFKKLYWEDIINEELMTKYDLKQFEGDYNIIDLYNLNKELYNVAININVLNQNAEKSGDIAVLANKDMIPFVQNYLSDIWEGKEDGEYNLSPEFEELKPKKEFENYLKKNDIKITKITYPTSANGFESIAGATVMNVTVGIEGTQDGKDFSKELSLDFYFVVTNSFRTGTPQEISPSNLEIMGVNLSSDKNSDLNGYNYNFDYENAMKDFGIN